jgi:hypothetical protein
MATKKIVSSKINGIGVMRQFVTQGKSKGISDQINGRALKKAYCGIDNDNITTYVQKRQWVISLNDYLYPPYVECEYVM